MKKPETIHEMEVVLEDFKLITFMAFFPCIKRLSLVMVNIHNMEGLRHCESLIELNLNDNSIKEIKGLENCTSLRKLFLSNNQITQIKGLSKLKELEQL